MTAGAAPRRAALLLVDVQRDFYSSGLGALRDGYRERVARLLAVARTGGLHVVHLHAVFAPDGSDWMRRYRARGRIPCVAGSGGEVVLAEAEPLEGEPVVVKQSFDGFVRTDLHERLRALDVDVVAVAGLVTGTCVLFTAASAAQLGYLVAVVEDASADEPENHVRVLESYPFVFDRVTIDSLVGWVEHAVQQSAERSRS